MDENTVLWIQLSLIFSPGNREIYSLYQKIKKPGEIIYQLEAKNIPNIPDFISENISSRKIKKQAEDIAGYCERKKISVIPIENTFYPESLMNISSPPAVLYCKGNLFCLNEKNSAAIVGARKADNYSILCAEKFAECLSQYGITVVSGFAKGIDSAAHKSAIENGGKTIAVLGGGTDYDYPSGTMKIKEKIAQNGAVISEYPPLEAPVPVNFKVRNRIIAGLSKAVLVVEAGEKSGSLNTVSHALEQGKDVFVIPPENIFDKRFAGQVELLEDGAQAVYSPEDFAREIISSF